MRIQRLLALVCVLADNEKVTVRELAERFEVSRRTIFRDLEALNCAGIPIVSQPGREGGVCVMEGYKVARSVLSSDDARRLFSALDGLRSIDGDPSTSGLIARLVPEREQGARAASRYAIDLSSWFKDSVVGKKLRALAEAIDDARCVSMDYISRSIRRTRVVEPRRLVFKQSDWYLHAFCRTRGEFRLFKLRRIAAFRTLDETFDPGPGSAIVFGEGYGAGLFSADEAEGTFQVVLEYDVTDEFALTERFDASFFCGRATGLGDGSTTGRISFYTPDLRFATDTVFGVLDKVRVIAPEELREAVRARLENVSSFYE